MHSLEATTLNGYSITQLLNQGNTSTVYEALQVNLNRHVALKVISSELAMDSDYIEDFTRQSQALAALNHNHIVQTFDAGNADGHHYIAMELVNGGDFKTLIEQEDLIDELHALQSMLKIAEGLNFAFEENNLTHGDIKPANILISSDGKPKLTDLGLARLGNHIFSEAMDPHPYYLAPEIITNNWDDTSPCADIYSFGQTIFHMITGAPAFDGEDFDEITNMHLEYELPDPTDYNSDIHPETTLFLNALCTESPEERPQTWSEVILKIKKLIKHIKQSKTRSLASNSSRRHSREKTSLLKPTLISACVLAAIIGVLLSITPPKTVYLNEIQPKLGNIPALESLNLLEDFVYRYGKKGEDIAGSQLLYYRRLAKFTSPLSETKLVQLQSDIESIKNSDDIAKSITTNKFTSSSGLTMHLPLHNDIRNYAGRFDLQAGRPQSFINQTNHGTALSVQRNFKYQASHKVVDHLSHGLSVSLWCKVKHGKSIILGVNGLMRISLDDGRVKFSIKAGNESQKSVAISTASLKAEQWHHLVISYPGLGGGKTKIWIDNKESALHQWSNSITKDYTPRDNSSLYSGAIIQLNKIRFYNRPLDQHNATELYKEQGSTELELLSKSFYQYLDQNR